MTRIALFEPEAANLNFRCRTCRPVVWHGLYSFLLSNIHELVSAFHYNCFIHFLVVTLGIPAYCACLKQRTGQERHVGNSYKATKRNDS